MTQLQKIVEEIKKVESGPLALKVWKSEIDAGNEVSIIRILRKEVSENREWIKGILGEPNVQMIEQFNPLKESDKYLSELMELYKEPKDLRQWDKIRIKVAECNMLLEMAAKK